MLMLNPFNIIPRVEKFINGMEYKTLKNNCVGKMAQRILYTTFHFQTITSDTPPETTNQSDTVPVSVQSNAGL